MSRINANTAGLMVTDAIAATEPGVAADGSLVPGRPAVPGGLTMGVYARGTDPNNKSIWHEAFSGVTVLEVPSLTREMIPSHVMPTISVERALHPRTGKPLAGLSLILADGVSTPLGFAGGRKRLNWTGVQPSQIFEAAEKVRDAGGSIESTFMLADGRFVVEGTLPLDAKSENRLGSARPGPPLSAVLLHRQLLRERAGPGPGDHRSRGLLEQGRPGDVRRRVERGRSEDRP